MSQDTANLVLTAVTALIALWAIIVSRQTASRQTQLQERLLALEGSRERDRRLASTTAKVSAHFEGPTSTRKLVVLNEGPSAARQISVTINGTPLIEHDRIPRGQQLVRNLGPGGRAAYLFSLTMGTPPVYTIAIEWEDDSGRPGNWSSELSTY